MISRLLFFFLVLVPFLLVAIPVQFVVTRLGLKSWHWVPRMFHRLGCAFLGMRVTLVGTPAHGQPTLLVSNHISWTDIVAIGSVADVTYVSKSEVAKWPFVNLMASLQKTIFVDRTRRSDAKRASLKMGERLASGTAVLLFAEGQSDVGTHVLPFRSALVGAAQHAMAETGLENVTIQPLTIAYTRLQGLPVSRHERSLMVWVKSKTFWQNIRNILSGGTREVTVAFGEPMPMAPATNRKVITKAAENQVRAMLVALNRGLPLPGTTK